MARKTQTIWRMQTSKSNLPSTSTRGR